MFGHGSIWQPRGGKAGIPYKATCYTSSHLYSDQSSTAKYGSALLPYWEVEEAGNDKEFPSNDVA